MEEKCALKKKIINRFPSWGRTGSKGEFCNTLKKCSKHELDHIDPPNICYHTANTEVILSHILLNVTFAIYLP